MTPYQVNVAAEAYVATLLSQAGYDVAMQYGTTQPDWDILATKSDRTLKVQVKGSQDGGWGLFQGYLQNADYHGAVDAWLQRQLSDVVFFFVQFRDVPVGHAPRCYVVRPQAILAHMRAARGGNGCTVLWENHRYQGGIAAGHTDSIPSEWLVTADRIDAV